MVQKSFESQAHDSYLVPCFRLLTSRGLLVGGKEEVRKSIDSVNVTTIWEYLRHVDGKSLTR